MERLILNNYVPYGQQRSKINLNFEEIFGRTDNLNNIDIYQYVVLEDGYTELFTAVNALDTFELTQSQSLWLRVLVLREGSLREERLYKFFKMGKGTYGEGGLQIGVDPSTFGIELIFIGAYSLNPSDDVRTQTIDLGWDITGTTISEFVNLLPGEGIEFQDNINGLVVVKVTNNTVGEEYLYNAEGGVYGADHLQTIPTNFNKFNSGSGILIVNDFQETTDAGNETTNPIKVQGISIGSNTAYSTQFGGGDFPAITTNTGLQQTAFGASAGGNNSGVNQVAVGIIAGKDNIGSEQVAIGFIAGSSNTGNWQTAVGLSAGFENKGINQVAIGANAGKLNTAAYQVAIGGTAGANNTGANQTAVGSNAGHQNKGTSQTVLGSSTGTRNTGDYQTAIGTSSGFENKGTNQVAVGTFAGYQNKGLNQSSLGYKAGFENKGSYQVALGISAGESNKGNNQVAIGHGAGTGNTFTSTISITSGGNFPVTSANATANNQFVLQTNNFPIRFDTNVAKALLFQLPLNDGRLATTDDVNNVVKKSNFLKVTADTLVEPSSYGKNGHLTVYVDTSAGNVTINPGSASIHVGLTLTVIKTTSDANTVIINPPFSEIINGVLTKILSSQYDKTTIESDGEAFFVTR